jgi:hypothetical protein
MLSGCDITCIDALQSALQSVQNTDSAYIAGPRTRHLLCMPVGQTPMRCKDMYLKAGSRVNAPEFGMSYAFLM